MKILAIETSCDETAAAVVEDGRTVLSNIINTQIKIHEKYGGVVPEIASRNHIEVISTVVKEALKQADTDLKDIEAIACTYGPGLVGALLVGVRLCKSSKLCFKKTTNTSKSHRRSHLSKLHNP